MARERAAAEAEADEQGTAALVVTGPAAVLRAEDGSERYLYRGAVVHEGEFSAASLEHNKSLGLIGPAD